MHDDDDADDYDDDDDDDADAAADDDGDADDDDDDDDDDDEWWWWWWWDGGTWKDVPLPWGGFQNATTWRWQSFTATGDGASWWILPFVKMIWQFGLEPFSVCLPCYPWHTEIQGKLWAYLEWGEIALHGQPYREACSKRSHLAVSWQMEPQ